MPKYTPGGICTCPGRLWLAQAWYFNVRRRGWLETLWRHGSFLCAHSTVWPVARGHIDRLCFGTRWNRNLRIFVLGLVTACTKTFNLCLKYKFMYIMSYRSFSLLSGMWNFLIHWLLQNWW
jgi:hypothetical protein